MKRVIGRDACVTINNPSVFTDKNGNGILCGKLLVVCEELPSNTEKEWKNLDNFMKPYITNKYITYCNKYEKALIVKNMNTLIILTNREAFKIGVDDRRFGLVDVDDKRIGDEKYFEKLWELVDGEDSKKVGEAFYWYCIEKHNKYLVKNNNKLFNASNALQKLITKTKQATIIDHLPTLYSYLKNEYIYKQKDIKKQLLKDFVKKYTDTLAKDLRRVKNNERSKYRSHNVDISTREVSKQLRMIDIKLFNSTDNKVYIPGISYIDLKNYYTKKHWLDEYDNQSDNEEKVDCKALDNKAIFIESDSDNEEQLLKNDILSDIKQLKELASRITVKINILKILQELEQIEKKILKPKQKKLYVINTEGEINSDSEIEDGDIEDNIEDFINSHL